MIQHLYPAPPPPSAAVPSGRRPSTPNSSPHRSPLSPLATAAAIAAPLTVIALAAALLLSFPPQQYAFYPRCPIYTNLHLLCPGCGTTRALAALLHGHLREALRLNALTTLLLPAAVLYAARCYWLFLHRTPGRTTPWPVLPVPALYTLLAITAVFTFVRNLPL